MHLFVCSAWKSLVVQYSTYIFPSQSEKGSFMLSIIFLFILTIVTTKTLLNRVRTEQFRVFKPDFQITFSWHFFSFPVAGAYICKSCDWDTCSEIQFLTPKIECLNLALSTFPVLMNVSFMHWSLGRDLPDFFLDAQRMSRCLGFHWKRGKQVSNNLKWMDMVLSWRRYLMCFRGTDMQPHCKYDMQSCYRVFWVCCTFADTKSDCQMQQFYCFHLPALAGQR